MVNDLQSMKAGKVISFLWDLFRVSVEAGHEQDQDPQGYFVLSTFSAM